MEKTYIWKDENPEIAHLDPTTDLIQQHKSDPFVAVLLGQFESVYSRYRSFPGIEQYVQKALNNRVDELTKQNDDYINTMKSIYEQILTRIETKKQAADSKKLTYWNLSITVLGAVAAVIAAIVSILK